MRVLTLLIIAGGKSSRLGQDKRFVEVGGVGLLENVLRKAAAQNFAEIFLCVEEILPQIKILAERYGAKILVDEVQGAGPMAALSNALGKISTDWALVVSVDMPFFNFERLQPLMNIFDARVVIPLVNGKFQPLAALYQKLMAEIFSRELSAGQRKLSTTIKKVPYKFVELPTDNATFFNVNTRADLRLARGRATNLVRRTPIISVVAPTSGTGKTTFIEKILKNWDLKIGVAKSTHHKIGEENFSKDSFRFRESGAKKIYVGADFLSVAEKFDDVDLILTESRTHGIFPAISLWRGMGEVIDDENVVAIFSNEPRSSDEIFQFDLDDISAAVEVCKFLAGK